MGLPAIIAQALMSVMTYGLNIILVRISENAVTAYGLYYKIQQFILFAAFGLRDAITPIVSFNYGMGSRSRVKQGIKYGMLYTLIIMAAGLILLEIFAEPLAGLFGLSGETQSLCVGAIRVISLSFIFAGANVAFQGIFQALEAGIQSLVISVCRQCLFVLPLAWGFSEVVISSGDCGMMWLVWLTFLI
ncbi:MAG: MATE family efflux transporter, partial [Oscillospiraceae bacterium]